MAMRVEKRSERTSEVFARPSSKDVTAARTAAKPRDESTRETTFKHAEKKATPSSVPEVTSTTDMVEHASVKRRRPRPPDLPTKKRHKTVQVPLPKSSTLNASVKSFRPTISLQKLFAGTSPRLVVQDNDLQPAEALSKQFSRLPRQHPIHNWTPGVKRHKCRVYTR